MTIPKKRYATVRQIPHFYPAFKESSIRQLIFFKNTNGFSKCIRKIGKKIIIDLDEFEAWINEH